MLTMNKHDHDAGQPANQVSAHEIALDAERLLGRTSE